MDGGVSVYLTAAGSSGGRKWKGETPTGEFGIVSTVSFLSVRRVCEMVKWCCSCTPHSTCSTKGLYTRVCECWNNGQNCMGCYCWGRCKNKGRLMPSPTTARVLLGHFPHGTDPPAVDQCAYPPPVRLLTSFSLQEILADGAGGGGTQGGAGGRKSPRYSGGGGRGAGGRTRERRGASKERRRRWQKGRRRSQRRAGGGGETEDPPGGKQDNDTGGKYHVGRTDTEESTSDSVEWSGEKIKESASEGEAETAGGEGEAVTTTTLMAEGPEGNGAEKGPGGAAAGGGATLNATAVEADAAGVGGHNGEENRERERVDSRR